MLPGLVLGRWEVGPALGVAPPCVCPCLRLLGWSGIVSWSCARGCSRSIVGASRFKSFLKEVRPRTRGVPPPVYFAPTFVEVVLLELSLQVPVPPELASMI